MTAERGTTAHRTYWHLEGLERRPDPYDIATSGLLYYLGRGFEVEAPLARWYAKHQQGSPLQCSEWERFRDPRETTYARYVAAQHSREVYVDGLFRANERYDCDRALAIEWIRWLDAVFTPLRFPIHGLQMVSAYVGQMAPSGRIVVTSALQAADELRRVQRIAGRTRQLQNVCAEFGADSRGSWERAPEWQPLREVVERLLVTYDWGEALVASNVVVKPMLDTLIVQLGQAARAWGDHVLWGMLASLDEDCAWHRAWVDALLAAAFADRPDNLGVVSDWRDRWRPAATEAVRALARRFDDHEHRAGVPNGAEVCAAVDANLVAWWSSLGLEGR